MTNNRFRRPLRFAALGAVAVLAATPLASAPVRADELHMRYEAYWGGMHIADFTLSLLNGGDTYENRFHLESRGLTRFFTGMAARATSKGRLISPPPPVEGNDNAPNAAAAPTSKTYIANTYRTDYTSKKHFRWVDIQFGEDGEAAKATTGTSPIPGREDEWDPKEKGPEVLDRVEDKDLIGVVDPITMVAQVMAFARTHLEGGPANGLTRGFDGRRRFDLDMTYMGHATRTVGETKLETYRVRVTPKPGPGFKERHRKIWEGSAYDFYLTRDGRFAPAQIMPVKHGPVLSLVKYCPSACELLAEEED